MQHHPRHNHIKGSTKTSNLLGAARPVGEHGGGSGDGDGDSSIDAPTCLQQRKGMREREFLCCAKSICFAPRVMHRRAYYYDEPER
jgi:hypothetical protein